MAAGVALTVVPILHIFSKNSLAKALRLQRVVHHACRAFLRFLEFAGLFHFDVNDTRGLQEPGVLVVANHPTLLDAIVLLAQMPQAYCVVKRNFHRNPFFAPPAAAAGYIASDDGLQMVNTCAAHLREGRSVIIFPEGTRSPVGELGPFERGSAHVVLRSNCKTVPVTIQTSPATLYRGCHWWDVPSQPSTFRVRVGRFFEPGVSFESKKSRTVAARSYTASLRDYFERELNLG